MESFWATLLVGGIFTPLNAFAPAPALRGLLDTSMPRVVILLESQLPLLREALAAGDSASTKGALPHLLVVGQEEEELPDPQLGTLHSYEALLRSFAPLEAWQYPARARLTSMSDTALLGFTSGSTGAPKGVCLPGAFVSAAGRLPPVMKLQMSVPAFSPLCSTMLVGAARDGVPIFLPPAFDANSLTQHIADHQLNFTAFFGDTLAALGGEDDSLASRCGTLAVLAATGVPLPVPLLRRVISRLPSHTEFMHAYGMTEFGNISMLGGEVFRPALAGGDPAAEQRMHSVGRPVPGVQLRVRDPATGADLAAGEAGEVVLRGPTLMSGYFNQPTSTAAALVDDGWFATGDRGYVDEEGYLFLSGRFKDIIVVSASRNVFPVQVENVVASVTGVASCCAFGVPYADDTPGERVAVAVTLAPDHPLATVLQQQQAPGDGDDSSSGEAAVSGSCFKFLSADAASGGDAEEAALFASIVERCEAELAPYAVPDLVAVVDSMPLIGVGKTSRQLVQIGAIANLGLSASAPPAGSK